MSEEFAGLADAKRPPEPCFVPDEVVGHGLSRLIPDSAADVATWLDARDPVRGGDLTRSARQYGYAPG